MVVAPTVETLLKLQDAGKRKLKAEHLARFLAMAQFKHRNGNMVSLPIEVVVMIGRHLVTNWKELTKAATEARVQASRNKVALLRIEVDKIRRRHPGRELSDLEIAGYLTSDPRKRRHLRRRIANLK